MSVMIRSFLSGCSEQRRDAAGLTDIAAEADRLIACFSEAAYAEARDRARGRCIDGAASARFWTRVKIEIARRQGIAIGLTGADLRA